MKSKALIILGIAIVTATAFQNCSANIFSSKNTKSENSDSYSGTGQGYGGKAYVQLQVTACTDGSYVKSRVAVKSATEAQLQRESCENLPIPRNLPAGKFTVNPDDPGLLSVDFGHGSETFVQEISSSSSANPCDPSISPISTGNTTGNLCNLQVTDNGIDKTVSITLYGLYSPNTKIDNFIGCYIQSLGEGQPVPALTPVGVKGTGTNIAGDLPFMSKVQLTFNIANPSG
ncbi:MAG: hypothetical protein ACXWQE_04260, partial [Bdellovibrionales bacterium]